MAQNAAMVKRHNRRKLKTAKLPQHSSNLVIGQESMCFRPKEVVVPDAEKTKNHGNVPLQGGRHEVVVDKVRSLQESHEVVEADVESDGHPNG